jgi:flagella basal body P-ring formation protein FlgA
LKRIPATADVLGLTARRAIAAGEPLTQAVLLVPPLVRAGDAVELTVIAGAVRVSARATASASGHEGDVIRVVPQGGRALKARITGPGAVEVVR